MTARRLSAIPNAYTENRSDDEEGDPVTIQNLVHMANQAAAFFASYPETEAIESTANHLKSFRDPRMRRGIETHLKVRRAPACCRSRWKP